MDKRRVAFVSGVEVMGVYIQYRVRVYLKQQSGSVGEKEEEEEEGLCWEGEREEEEEEMITMNVCV